MASQPPEKPDRIDPVAPPERPAPVPDHVPDRPPETEPLGPDIDQPPARPEEYPMK